MGRSYDNIEEIRQKSTMSQQIVDQRDSDYALYAGADYETARQMALIDTMMELKIFPENSLKWVKFFRKYLNQQRKAFFASVGSTEVTKLGFILGFTDKEIPF